MRATAPAWSAAYRRHSVVVRVLKLSLLAAAALLATTFLVWSLLGQSAIPMLPQRAEGAGAVSMQPPGVILLRNPVGVIRRQDGSLFRVAAASAWIDRNGGIAVEGEDAGAAPVLRLMGPSHLSLDSVAAVPSP